MSDWGIGMFANDSALDFVAERGTSDDVEALFSKNLNLDGCVDDEAATTDGRKS